MVAAASILARRLALERVQRRVERAMPLAAAADVTQREREFALALLFAAAVSQSNHADARPPIGIALATMVINKLQRRAGFDVAVAVY